MTTRLYTDDQIAELQSMPKRVTNPRARWSDKPGHRQRNFQLTGLEDESRRFQIYLRQNEADVNDFSCGIAYLPIGGNRLTLARYNGPSHIHRDIRYRAHIHRATAKAIAEGRKPESEADETDRYTTLNGAFRCLVDDFQVQGITPPEHDRPRLFHDS
jgi:hypothetical protein